ncbi:hypothetical protein RHS03_01075, partial [Rhizoctonia solani]
MWRGVISSNKKLHHPTPSTGPNAQDLPSGRLPEAEMHRRTIFLYPLDTINVSRGEEYLVQNEPKGNIPSWLADTFDALSKKHPLRDATDGHAVTQSMGSDLSDDDNPFAYKAPSPPRAPSTLRFTALPDAVQQEQPRNRRYMNLSSIPFAPPTFVEPTYEDHYQDVIVPLNDFDDKHNNPAHWAGVESSDSKPVPPILRASSQLETPQRMSSSLFSPRAYPFPLIATTPVPHIGPPDDIIFHTPTHNNVLEPEADETHDTLCTKHPFGIPMYPSSPARSFREFPLDALVGSREPSPYILSSASRNTSSSSAIRGQFGHFGTPGREVILQPHFQPRLASSDIYKSKLLAYATVVADHMSSSGDEGSAYQQSIEYANVPEVVWAASSPATQYVHSPSRPLEKRPIVQHDQPTESCEPFGHNNIHLAMVHPYTKILDPDSFMEPELDKTSATGRSGHYTTSTRAVFPVNSFNADHSNEDLSQAALGNRPELIESIYAEGPENESQIEDSASCFEDDRSLLSEYEATQAECDTLAAGEPSDSEDGTMEQHEGPASFQGPDVERSAAEINNSLSVNEIGPPKKNPKIQPFPMKASRRSLTAEAIAPDRDQSRFNRRSPKFVSRPPKRVRPSPFAALLEKRFKEYPKDVVELKDQTVVDEGDRDEIESWSG